MYESKLEFSGAGGGGMGGEGFIPKISPKGVMDISWNLLNYTKLNFNYLLLKVT